MTRLPARTTLTAALLLALAATAWGQWVEDSIDVGGRWVGSLAYNSREDVVYGASERGPVFAIDCSSNQVIASFNALGPNDIAYCSTENKAYCTAADTLIVIDGASHTRLKAMYLEWASNCVWDPVNNCVYVSCLDDNDVAVIDCMRDSVVDRIGVGRDPIGMHLSTRHHKLYVLNHDGESISIIDLETHEVVETIRLDNVPEAGCYSAAVDKFYCGAGNEVVVVDGAGDSVLSVIAVPVYMTVRSAVAVESESLVMVGTSCPTAVDTLYVVDAIPDTLIAVHPVGGTPRALIWSPATGLVYAAVSGIDDVVVIDEDGSRILASLPVGEFPFCLASSPERKRLYVGHLNGDHVYVIRDSVTGMSEHAGVPSRPVPSITFYPNPFSRRVVLRWSDLAGGGGEIAVYAGSGRKVKRILPEASTSGDRIAVWDGTDETGRAVPPGVYCVVAGENGQNRARVVKLK